jgi:uncharacterized membrane protein
LNLGELRVVFIVVTGILMLLVASPGLSRVLVYPRTEFFTEVYLLGPNHNAENYPFNITRDQNYSVYLDVGNQLGYCAYYVVEVKFKNETEPGPTNLVSSSLPSLLNITAFVADQAVWEVPVNFAFDYGVNLSVPLVEFHSITFNGVVLNLTGKTAVWNATNSWFNGSLFFEVWIYNGTTSSFQYHQRAVWLQFNMTN